MNTGWTGGGYGVGSRLELAFTRAMIKAAFDGSLAEASYRTDDFFGLSIPTSCPDVPNAILNPRDTWRNEEAYDRAALNLANLFHKNFEPFAEAASQEIIDAGPTAGR